MTLSKDHPKWRCQIDQQIQHFPAVLLTVANANLKLINNISGKKMKKNKDKSGGKNEGDSNMPIWFWVMETVVKGIDDNVALKGQKVG